MELRAAGSSERGEIRRLLAQSGLPVADLEDSAIEFLVAIADGALVGTVGIERHGDVGLLRSLTVAPAQRGSGLGSRLVGALEAHAAASGVNELVLLTTTARDFFERRGYLEIAREDAPGPVRASAEFRSLCPASSTCMLKSLGVP